LWPICMEFWFLVSVSFRLSQGIFICQYTILLVSISFCFYILN
jgi:hypothetical protein